MNQRKKFKKGNIVKCVNIMGSDESRILTFNRSYVVLKVDEDGDLYIITDDGYENVCYADSFVLDVVGNRNNTISNILK